MERYGREIILASASPRRRELLDQIGISDYRVVPSEVEETVVCGMSPAATAMHLARAKARAVAETAPAAVVIAADTLVVLDDVVLGKPADRREAAAMLTALSGREHAVITGFTIRQGSQREVCDHVRTKVIFRPLTSAEIVAYLATGEADDKAGAYGIQGRAAVFVERIEGCYFNVVGLPVSALARALAGFGVRLWPEPNAL